MVRDLHTTVFQKGDLIRGEDGRTEKYLGPTYKFSFPEGVNMDVHVRALSVLGFRIKNDETNSRSIFLYGDFSNERDEYIKTHGVKIELIKERGIAEPCPWR